eukprot:4235756-Amphidinium_carterae.1
MASVAIFGSSGEWRLNANVQAGNSCALWLPCGSLLWLVRSDGNKRTPSVIFLQNYSRQASLTCQAAIVLKTSRMATDGNCEKLAEE